jgi:hypothetical protein
MGMRWTAMNDFATIARILAAIRQGEQNPPFNVALVDERVLKTTARNRDLLAIKLRDEGYIDGLMTTEDIDNAELAVLWQYSSPTITLKGMEYMQTCKPLKKAGRQLKEIGTDIAAKAIQAQINQMF